MIRRNLLYARLSRQDDEVSGTTDEKLAGQVESCLRLAERDGQIIHEQDILIEQASGGTLAERPQLLKLLHLCRRGEVARIYCTFPDRLSRLEGRDRAEFEEALEDGGVTVVSSTGATLYDHEEEPFGRRVLAEAAAYELRAFGRRKKERNAQKLARNERTGGHVPYGWKKDPHAPGGYTVIPERYAVRCRVLREILAGRSAWAICRDLMREGVPAPGGPRNPVGKRWTSSTIRQLALNPFNAGRHSQRSKQVKRGGRKVVIPLRPDEFVIAPDEGEWEHPLTWDEYLQIAAAYATHRRPNPREGLLTGIFYCPAGNRMARSSPTRYACFICERYGGVKHSILRSVAEGAAIAAAADALERMPEGALGTTGRKTDRAAALRDRSRAVRVAKETFDAVHELATRAAFFTQIMGDGPYQQSLERASAAHAAAKAEVARIEDVLSEPEPKTIMPVVVGIRKMGFQAFWGALTPDEQRTLLRAVVARVDMVEQARRVKRVAPVVTLNGWVAREIG